MADFSFNNAKGKIGYYLGLPAANDAIILVVLEASGLEADATLKDYNDLAALLAGTSNEQTVMGRKTLSSGITLTVDDTNDRLDATMANPVWTAATGNATGAVLVCYDADTTAGTDADVIPLAKHDFIVTPDGTDITGVVPSGGFFRSI